MASVWRGINHVTEVIPVWKEISELPPGTLVASQVPGKRAEGWVCLTATGLNIIGRVGHRLFSQGQENWKSYADKLGAINWKRDADIWQGNIIQGNRILTQRFPLRTAFEKVSKEIELPIS